MAEATVEQLAALTAQIASMAAEHARLIARIEAMGAREERRTAELLREMARLTAAVSRTRSAPSADASLLAELFACFDRSAFTAKEAALRPELERHIRAALAGEDPTVRKLGKRLSTLIGASLGEVKLAKLDTHERDGALWKFESTVRVCR